MRRRRAAGLAAPARAGGRRCSGSGCWRRSRCCSPAAARRTAPPGRRPRRPASTRPTWPGCNWPRRCTRGRCRCSRSPLPVPAARRSRTWPDGWRRSTSEGRERLRALLARTGVAGAANPHAGHDMPGMPTAADLEALEGLRGAGFDRRFAALLRAYLGQLVLVADGERRSGQAADVRALAAAMSRAHAAELGSLAAAAR
ncbi:DUF305 domain-containing protein [Actinomadura sp. ATCC 31491]|uniref:DUF305 domain-containing protein n=1 Tax=Actinomadura luzonensis TaxID=2805427 RepID=A0ABT0FL82_9ACTN|nr:DUF305 domain-containing protein [Actinomadura luzonensis]MCK2213087.1 DUF305 domain-containing protein [Actinomadura luzonensis]